MAKKAPESPLFTACGQFTKVTPFVLTGQRPVTHHRGVRWEDAESRYVLTEHGIFGYQKWWERSRIITFQFVLSRIALEGIGDDLLATNTYNINRTGVTAAFTSLHRADGDTNQDISTSMQGIIAAEETGLNVPNDEDRQQVEEALRLGALCDVEPHSMEGPAY